MNQTPTRSAQFFCATVARPAPNRQAATPRRADSTSIRSAPTNYRLLFLVLTGLTFAVSTSQAQQLSIGGSPTWSYITGTGYESTHIQNAPGWGVNNIGTAVGYASKSSSNTSLGGRAVRWDASGTAATELGNLGTDNDGNTSSIAYAVNESGTVVGYAQKFNGSTYLGSRAVRWDAAGTAATELGNLGTDNSGATSSSAYAVNTAGTAVGSASIWNGNGNLGASAVRWDASGTAATDLGGLGTDGIGRKDSNAFAVNAAGTAVGYAQKYSSNSNLGYRAVRWDASGTAATELGNLGTNSIDQTNSQAYAVNAAGTAVGYAYIWNGNTSLGQRAVRWDASGTVATQLANLDSGSRASYAVAVNDSGTAVGVAYKYNGNTSLGPRAVRWDAAGTAATELGNLGTYPNGQTYSYAYAVNAAGTAVGSVYKHSGDGTYVRQSAVAWLPDASVIDLNDLGVVPVDGGGTWTLTTAKALSADGWVSGEGDFDPTGADGAYYRGWVGQVGLGGSWLNTSGANNTWGKGANWSSGTPAIQRDAVFDQTATYTVAFARDEHARTLAVVSGTVTLSLGGQSVTPNHAMVVGGSQPTTLLINGGTVVNDGNGAAIGQLYGLNIYTGEGYIGLNEGTIGTVTVSGAGSQWMNGADTWVGYYGNGTLNITAGGLVQNNYEGYVARFASSTGTVTVSGAGSQWNNLGSLSVGSSDAPGGVGIVSVGTGGEVQVGGTIKLWTDATVNLNAGGTIRTANLNMSQGTFNFNGGTLIVSGSLTTPGNGALDIPHGLLVNNGNIAVPITVSADGMVKGSGTYASLTLNGGKASPGNSPGTMTDVTTAWTSGSYLWEISKLDDGMGAAELGNNPGWDLWNTGTLTVGSTFAIELQSLQNATDAGSLTDWNPTESHQWLIATSDNGAFDFLTLANLNAHLNVNGFSNYNSLGGGHFDLIAGAGGNNLILEFTAVPEPGTVVAGGLALLGLGWGWLRRRRVCL